MDRKREEDVDSVAASFGMKIKQTLVYDSSLYTMT